MVEMDGNLSRENEYLPIDVHEQHALEVNDRVHKTLTVQLLNLALLRMYYYLYLHFHLI